MPIKPLVFVAAIGGTAVAAAIGVNVFLWQDEVKVTLTATPTPAQAPAKTASPEITAETPPSFDVVRVDPGGNAVMAGRARPGSKVVILDNGKPGLAGVLNSYTFRLSRARNFVCALSLLLPLVGPANTLR